MHSPRIEIHYCTGCRWLLRSAWYAQELLTTFETSLGEVALVPGSGGIFQIHLQQAEQSELIWDRKRDGGFPDIKWLKQQIRDRIAPDRDLGHSERST